MSLPYQCLIQTVGRKGETFRKNRISVVQGGKYQALITSPYGSVTSAVATLTVALPPSIVKQPFDVAVAVGGSASISAGAAGAPPLFYSWYFNRTNLVTGGTASTLTLTNVNLTEAGGYTVVVTNAFGSITSRVANLSVGFSPVLINQPASQTNPAGAGTTFSVLASGTGAFTYQWQLNGTNLPNNIISTVAGNGTARYSGD